MNVKYADDAVFLLRIFFTEFYSSLCGWNKVKVWKIIRT